MSGKKISLKVNDFAVDPKFESLAQEFLSSPAHQAIVDTEEIFAQKLLTFAEEVLQPQMARRCDCEGETLAMGTAFPYFPMDSKKGIPCVPREYLLRTTMEGYEYKKEHEHLDAYAQDHIVRNIGVVCAHIMDYHRNTATLKDVYKRAKTIISYLKSHKCDGVKCSKSRAARAIARAVVCYEHDQQVCEDGKIGLSTETDKRKYLEKKG